MTLCYVIHFNKTAFSPQGFLSYSKCLCIAKKVNLTVEQAGHKGPEGE